MFLLKIVTNDTPGLIQTLGNENHQFSICLLRNHYTWARKELEFSGLTHTHTHTERE